MLFFKVVNNQIKYIYFIFMFKVNELHITRSSLGIVNKYLERIIISKCIILYYILLEVMNSILSLFYKRVAKKGQEIIKNCFHYFICFFI